jgi:D-aminopeptidase
VENGTRNANGRPFREARRRVTRERSELEKGEMESGSTGDSPRRRARDLGIRIGRLATGKHNAITDVDGVSVGHTTLISGEGPLRTGQGPVRTGVTVILPTRDDPGVDPVYAGVHRLNGNGEMTGTQWIEEAGLLSTPIAITNTHSVGVVRDAIIEYELKKHGERDLYWSMPVVAETYDGWINDINGFHVRPEHVFAAFDSASSTTIGEGCVGGGTGMNCHEFKGGIGTSSRKLREELGGWTIGALVQANYGRRYLLHIDGVPVGEEIGPDVVPSPWQRPRGDGSIIIVLATDAPLLPHQCKRLAQRATIGLARVGGNGDNGSGDLFIAFSTANRGMETGTGREPAKVATFPNTEISNLFEAAIDATQEAIVNAICMATTMTGRDGRTSTAIPLDLLQETMRKYGRLHEPN